MHIPGPPVSFGCSPISVLDLILLPEWDTHPLTESQVQPPIEIEHTNINLVPTSLLFCLGEFTGYPLEITSHLQTSTGFPKFWLCHRVQTGSEMEMRADLMWGLWGSYGIWTLVWWLGLTLWLILSAWLCVCVFSVSPTISSWISFFFFFFLPLGLFLNFILCCSRFGI